MDEDEYSSSVVCNIRSYISIDDVVLPSNKLKEPHFQVKFMSECSILHWNYIHPRPYIHTFFQVISLTIIKILYGIGWFTRRNQNWVIVTLAGACPQNPSTKTLPIKIDPGTHRHN